MLCIDSRAQLNFWKSVLFYLGGCGPQAKQFSQKVCFSLANQDTSICLAAALPSLSAFNMLCMTIFMLEECLVFVNYYSWMFFLRFDSRQQFDICFALFLGMIMFVNTGFRSRVKYFSIMDPTQMTYYISEILDAGLQGPLFMVSFSFSVPSAHLFFCSSVCLYLSVDAFTGDYRKLSRRSFYQCLS